MTSRDKLQEALTYSNWSSEERELILRGVDWILKEAITPLGLMYLEETEKNPDKSNWREFGKIMRETYIETKKGEPK